MLPETNIAPENGWNTGFPFGMTYLQEGMVFGFNLKHLGPGCL